MRQVVQGWKRSAVRKARRRLTTPGSRWGSGRRPSRTPPRLTPQVGAATASRSARSTTGGTGAAVRPAQERRGGAARCGRGRRGRAECRPRCASSDVYQGGVLRRLGMFWRAPAQRTPQLHLIGDAAGHHEAEPLARPATYTGSASFSFWLFEIRDLFAHSGFRRFANCLSRCAARSTRTGPRWSASERTPPRPESSAHGVP